MPMLLFEDDDSGVVRIALDQHLNRRSELSATYLAVKAIVEERAGEVLDELNRV